MTFSLPGGRSFRLLLTSLAVSSCGDWLYNVALLALVYGATGSPTWVALTTAARVLPIVVLGPLGGIMADRYDRRRLIVASDLARAGLMVALAAVAAGGLPILLAPVLAAAATAAGTVQPPAVAASTPRLVAEDELQRAQGLRAAVGQSAIVAGPALGALLLALSSPAVAILLNALSFVGSAVAISAIQAGPAFRPAARRAGAALPGIGEELRAGLDALRGAPAAVRLFAADVICSAVYGLLTVTLVLVAHRVGAGDGGYGILLGAFGVGGVAGATLAGRLEAARRWRGTLAVALTLIAFALVMLGLVHALWAALALALVGGVGGVVAEVLSETALPQLLDEAVLGRAYALALPASLGGIVAGSLIAGPLVALLGLTGTLAVAGCAVLGLGALLLRRPLQVAAPAPALA
jgi:MFS family permease